MDFKIKDPSKIEIFTTIFQIIKSISEQISIHFTDEKMFIQTMDPSKVSVLEIAIRSTWFDFYSCQEDDLHIGINTSILHRILSSKEKTQTIHFEYNTEDTGNEDKLFVNMVEITPTKELQTTNEGEVVVPTDVPKNYKNVYNRYFEVPLINLENELMEIPSIDYEAEISLPSINFAILIHQLKGFGEVLNIKCNENDIQFISKSAENGSMRVEIKIDELSGFSIIEGENINVSFSLQYINTISAYSKISKMVELKIRRDYPIRVDYLFGETEEGSIKFFLSPKIGEDDDMGV
jgi:DNA polymerase III sliding clamp (beta) subunit (PCNA family)